MHRIALYAGMASNLDREVGLWLERNGIDVEKLKTKDGVVGEVQRVDVLRQKVKLIVEDENGDKEIQEYKIDDLLMRKKKPQGCQGCSKGCNNKNQGCNKGHGKRKN